MALKKYALNPAEREKECPHELGFSYTGTIPCTGPKVCYMCGTRQDDNDMAGHTPEPWGLEGTPEFGFAIRGSAPGRPIADNVTTLANARLMAAAPRMYDALKAISEVQVHDDTNHRELLALLMATASITVKEIA